MTTFSNGLRIILSHKLYIAIYVVWLCVMMVMMSFTVVSGSVRGDDGSVFSTAKASVAVVNRDDTAAGSHLAQSLRQYLAVSNTVVRLDDSPATLQNAVATDHVNLIAIVPQGYASDFAKACRRADVMPKLDTVTSYSSSLGTMSQMDIDAFLDAVRISVTAMKSYDDDGLTDAAKQAVADKRNADDSGENTVRVVSAGAKQDAAPAAAGFAFTTKLICYFAFVAVTVIVSVALSSFEETNRRRRLAVCATPQSRIGTQLVLVCVVFSAVIWALYMFVSVGLMAICGADIGAIAPGGYAMAGLSMLLVILAAAGFGYMLSAAGLSDIAVNGAANVVGLVIMFTSGMMFSPSIMPQSLITLGKLLPGWWYCLSIDNALGVSAAPSADMAHWAQDAGLVALFGIAFVCLGLALRRMRVRGRQ